MSNKPSFETTDDDRSGAPWGGAGAIDYWTGAAYYGVEETADKADEPVDHEVPELKENDPGILKILEQRLG